MEPEKTARLYLPAGGPGLWTPSGSRRATDPQTQYLPDLGMYVSSPNLFYALRSRLRSYPIDEFLALVSRASFLQAGRTEDLRDMMRRQGWQPELALRNYQMAFLVKVMLQDHDWPGERAWPVQTDAEKVRILHECTRMASNVLSAADKPAEKGADHAWAMMSRIANQQFGDFEDLGKLYPRALLLYGECAGEAETQQGITLTDVLRARTGLESEDAMFLAFGVFSLLSQGNLGHLLERDVMTSSPEFPGITAEGVGRLFDWLSIDYEGFRRAGELPEAGAEEGYEPYNLNPLVRYPIVRTPRGHYVIPIVPYLLRRVTTGLFYDLIDSPHSGRVGNVLGRAVELYVRKLIEDLPLRGALTPETQYAPGKTTCDWTLDDPDGVVVIECKRASLRQGSRTTGQREDIKRDLKKEGGVADGVAKLAETAEAIRSGRVQGVESGKRIIGLLVTLDQFFQSNTRYLRTIVEEVLQERGVELRGLEYQVCSIPDFEVLCRLLVATHQTLSTAIASKVDGTRNIPGDLPTGEWDFAAWVNRAWPEGAEGRVQILDKVFDEALDSLAGRFR